MVKKNRYLEIDPYWFLETTVHQEGDNIFNLAYRLCQNREEAEKIAREAFLKTLKSYRRFESRFHIYTFLCRTTFDIWKSRAGRRTKCPTRPLCSSAPTSSETVAVKPMASLNEIGKEEQLQIIRKGIAGLSAPDNFIIVLRDVEGKSYLEIACILKCHYHTVKSRLTQARKGLYANILSNLENHK